MKASAQCSQNENCTDISKSPILSFTDKIPNHIAYMKRGSDRNCTKMTDIILTLLEEKCVLNCTIGIS